MLSFFSNGDILIESIRHPIPIKISAYAVFGYIDVAIGFSGKIVFWNKNSKTATIINANPIQKE